VLAQAASDPETSNIFSVGSIPHPSIGLDDAIGGDSVKLIGGVTFPLLLAPAQNDPDVYRPNGALFESLLKSSPKSEVSLKYGDVTHGFAPRGDITDPLVKERVEQVVEESLSFFAKHI
jgi:hypothetical protein